MALKTRLTKTVVKNAQPTDKDVIVWDDEVAGFGLKVTPKGKKSFILQHRTLEHKERKLKIGDCSALTPEVARDLAKDILTEVRRGHDPAAARKAKRSSRGEGTLTDWFDDFKKHKRADGLRSIDEIERIFEHDILPEFGKRKPEEITTQEVSRFLDKIAGRSASVAWAARRQMSSFYSWAIPKLPAGAFNPVTNASKPPKVNARDRHLTDEELKSLWQALENEQEPWRTGLRLMILTGQRRREVLEADWNEFDLTKKVWIIPAARSKNRKAHVVPLSPAVLRLLKALPNRKGPLFPVGTGIAGRAAKRIRKAMGGVEAFRWHDFRRTVATGLQRLGVRWEVTEAVLNHISGSKAGIAGVYQQHHWTDDKRDALNKWGQHVTRIVTKSRAGKAT